MVGPASHRQAVQHLRDKHQLSDSLFDGRQIRVLNVLDDCTPVSVAVEVGQSLSGEHVARVLDRAAARFG